MWFFSSKSKQGDPSPTLSPDLLLKQLNLLHLALACDPARPFAGGRLQLVLTINNHTDQELSPALLILMARNQAWHVHDPRMGRANVEFDLRDFNKKVVPGASRDYRLSVKMMSTIKPGDGIWLSFEYRGHKGQLLSNRVRVPDVKE